MQTQLVIEHISQWLKEYLDNSGLNGFVIGISGGIDSAVTSTLAARTGAQLLVLEMPIHQAEDQVSRGNEHIEWLMNNFDNVSRLKIDLTETFNAFSSATESKKEYKSKDLSLANARARLRMTTLYYYAGVEGLLVTGTGNKIEDFGVGFFTKYGDGGVDISPIADLMKSEVFAIAKELNIIESIQNAAPTDGLWNDNRTDEDQMGATYNELEWAMQYQPNKKDNLNEREQEVLNIYKRLNSATQHKIKPIPVCEIPEELR